MKAIVTASAVLLLWAGAAAAQGVVTVLPAPGTVTVIQPPSEPPPTTVLHSPYEEVPPRADTDIPPRPGTTEPWVQIDRMRAAQPSSDPSQSPPAAPTGISPGMSPGNQQSAAAPWPSDQDSEVATQALNALEGAGYGVFSNFQRKGAVFEATVLDHGRQRNVVIDPGTGSITPED